MNIFWKLSFFQQFFFKSHFFRSHLFFNFEMLGFSNFFQIFRIFQISGAVCYQMELSPSWRGVGWANGSCGVVIEACTSRVPGVWGSGDGLEMIFGCLRTFSLFLNLFSRNPAYSDPASWIRCVEPTQQPSDYPTQPTVEPIDYPTHQPTITPQPSEPTVEPTQQALFLFSPG